MLTVNAVMDVYNGLSELQAFSVPTPGVLANDPVGVGTRSAIQLTNTAAGNAVLSADGAFTFAPGSALRQLNAGDVSIQEFTYRVSDAGDGTTGTEATVRLFINGLNDQTTAANTTQALTYVEDGGVRSLGAIVVDDPDVNDQITATLRLSDAAAGTLAAPGAGFNAGTLTFTGSKTAVNAALAAVSFTPSLNYDKNFTISVTISDGLENGTTAVTGTITVTVTATNADAPSANSSIVTVNEDSISNFVFLQGTDPDTNPASPRTFSLVGGATHGTVSLFDAANGVMFYTPSLNYNGPDSFLFKVTDSTGLISNIATVNVTVNPVNDVPSFTVGGSQSVTEDSVPQTVTSFITTFSPGPANEAGQLVNFLVSNNNSTLFSVQPAIDSTGRLTYTPAPNQNGTATVSVQIHDNGTTANGGVDTSAPQTFTISIASVNDGPVSAGDTYTTNQDTQLIVTAAAGILANDSDAHSGTANENNLPLTALLVTNPSHGSLALNANGAFTYQPTAGYNGPDSFTYQAADGLFARGNTVTVTILVGAVNQAPTFTVGSNQISLEDAGAQSVPGFIPAFSAGPAGESSQVINFIVSTTNSALFSVQPTIDATGRLTYTATPNQNGVATVTVQIHDNGSTANGGVDTSAPQTFTLTITPVNDGPVSANDSYATSQNTPLTVTAASGLLANDSDTHNGSPGENNIPLTVSAFTSPFHGSLILNSNGSFTYSPAHGFSGSDAFSYQAADSLQQPGNTATVNITVGSVNQAPSFTIGTNQTAIEDAGPQSVAGFIPAFSAGPASESSQLIDFIVSNNNSSLFGVQPSIDPTGKLTYTSAADRNGVATVTVQIHDNGTTANGGIDTSAPQTFTITITPANDGPIAADDAYSTNRGQPLLIAAAGVLANDTDIRAGATDENNIPLTAVLVGDVSHGSLSLGADGSFLYTPTAGYSGPDSFTYQAVDSLQATSNTATVRISVGFANTIPVVHNGTLTVVEDTPATGILSAADADNDPLTYLVAQPQHGTVVITDQQTGAFLYTPAQDYNGPDQFTFKVNDGTADSNTATVLVNVTAVNDPPVVSNTSFTVPEQSALGFVVGIIAATDIDTGDTRSYSISGGNTNNAFAIDSLTGLITVANSAALDFETSPVFHLVITVTDAGGLQATSNVTITLTNVDDPLQLILPSGPAQFYSRRGPVIIDPAALVLDEDGPAVNLTGGSLTARITGNASSSDRLGLVDQGNGPGLLDIQGNTVKFDGRVIGKITQNGKGGGQLTISFTSAITERAVNALLKLLTFNNADSFPFSAQRTVTIRVANATGSRQALNTQRVDVLSEPVPRWVLVESSSNSYVNGSAPVVIDPTASVSGPFDLGFHGASLSVKITSGSNSQNRLGIANLDGITLVGKDVLYNGRKIGRATLGNNSLSVKLSGSDATPTAVQALLRAVTFSTMPDNTNLSNRIASFRLTEVTGARGRESTRPIFVSAQQLQS